MAGGSLYRDEDDDAAITDINVTPFVDVVLVLLVVFIVTISFARGVEIETPKMASGVDVPSSLTVSVNAAGELFVNGDKFTDDPAAIARIKQLAATTAKPQAIIDGDRRTAYGGVTRAIDLVLAAGITAIKLKNQPP